MRKLPNPPPQPNSSSVTFDLPAKIKVRDKDTGFTGIIDIRAQRINSCKQYHIRPQIKDGKNKLLDGIWLDYEAGIGNCSVRLL